MKVVVATMLQFYAAVLSSAQSASITATQFQLDPTALFITFTGIDPLAVASFRIYKIGDTYCPDGNGHIVVDSEEVTPEYIDSAVTPIVGMSSETIRLKK